MKSTRILVVVIIAIVLAILGGRAVTAQDKQDKYTLKVPDGLAFSEFRGYETWQVVALSHTLAPEGGRGAMTSDQTLNVIVANPVMIKAYQAGIPGNGKPWPDGSKAAKIQYIAKKSAEAPFNVAVPDTLKDVAFMAKDGKRFRDSRGWGYAMFNYDPASDRFTPDGTGAKCGATCHTIAKAKDYVFTTYGKR
ncbi:MAG: cytochrome P460 family protein [Candidatus Rokuibacteriota bacterium]